VDLLKVRKLEFLMAAAKAQGHDSVITVGGIQSNHCRATATAAKYLGLEPHLILRNTERGALEDPGLAGNLLVERLQGAHVHQVWSCFKSVRHLQQQTLPPSCTHSMESGATVGKMVCTKA
jgi:1-aminocyclopropane-1-carboxylate deaminase/D-cysteine desulfhydrase-like pyridoxal-dependent ACC family enzyme